MSEPDISTLARRLAEQNNVDWRALGGSGPDGKVVERDVLDYLARVMAGEEATNPTPEPLPSGMEVWPDQGLDNFRTGVNAGAGEASGSLGDLRDELGRSVRPEAGTRAPASAEPEADDVFGAVESVQFGSREVGASDAGGTGLQTDTDGVDEDIFLFDDDDAVSDSAGADGAASDVWSAEPVTESGTLPTSDTTAGSFGEAATDAPAGSTNDDLDDLLVAGEELAEDDEGADATSDAAFSTGFGNDLTTESEQGSAGALSTSAFGELTTPGFDERDDGLGLGEDDDSDFGSGSSAAADQAADQSEDAWGSNISLGADSDSFAGTASAGADSDATDLWGEPEKENVGNDLWSEGTAETAAADASTLGEESPWGSSESASAPGDRQLGGEPWSAGIAGEDSIAGEADFAGEDTIANEGTFGGDQVAGATLSHEDDVDDARAAVGGAELNVGTAVAGNLPLARSATILRRHIDLSALASSQVSVGNELGFDEPLGVGPFLLRAVAKAAGALDVPVEHVALAVLGDGLRLRRVSDAAERSFSSLVGELAEEVVEEDEPRLVAADLSVLDLDEALLDLDVPVVTLGRILYDNQRGAYRSTLTLTGAIHPDAGAKLLARVAELLDAPVRLVL